MQVGAVHGLQVLVEAAGHAVAGALLTLAELGGALAGLAGEGVEARGGRFAAPTGRQGRVAEQGLGRQAGEHVVRVLERLQVLALVLGQVAGQDGPGVAHLPCRPVREEEEKNI